MKNFEANIPKKPSYMTEETYAAAIAAGHCVRFLNGDCGDTPCNADENGRYDVDFDHIYPASKNGGNGVGNIQLLCRNNNRWEKGISLDPRYVQNYWWDDPINLDALRQVQVEKAWDEIFRLESEGQWISSPPDALMRVFMLMLWIVGSGKTIGFVVAVKAINHIINSLGHGRRRATRVLVLAPQRSLADQLAHEFRTELLDLGICQTAPRVIVVEDSDDWAKAELRQADIVVACSASIWDTVGRDSGKGLSVEQLRRYLSSFEVVGVDEGHYAIEQHAFLASLMPRAFKFAMTATPMDKDGNWLKTTKDGWDLFALLSVYGYKDAASAKSLRQLLTWEEGIESGFYIPVNGGDSEELAGGSVRNGGVDSKNDNNLTRDIVVVRKACDASIRQSKTNHYDGHIMVVCENIVQAKAWEDRINGIDDMTGEKFLPDRAYPGNGWKAAAVYSGSKGAKLSDRDHPWNVARYKNGRAQKDSCRLVCVVNIGQYGINNKCCNTIAWVGKNMSLNEIIQRAGRALRRWFDGDQTHPCLVWPGKYPEMTERIKEAIEYILNMEDYALNHGHQSVADYLNEADQKRTPGPVHRVPHLSLVDRANIEKRLGRLLIDTGRTHQEIDEYEIEQTVEDWSKTIKPPAPEKLEPAKQYAKKMLAEESYRARVLGLSMNPVSEPITTKENAPEIYDDALLRQAIEDGKIGDPKIRPLWMALLGTDDGKRIVSSEYAKHEQRYFSINKVTPGSFANEIKKIAYEVQIATLGHNGKPHGDFFKAANMSVARYFELPNIQDITIASYEANLCDAITRGRARCAIMGMTRALYLSWNKAKHPELAALYADIINRHCKGIKKQP